MFHLSSSPRRHACARTAALAALAIAALGATVAAPAQAGPIGPCHGPCVTPPKPKLVTVYRNTSQYSTPYFNARTVLPLRATTYFAICEAPSSAVGPYNNHWWTKFRSGTWVNNGYLKGGVKMGIGDCTAPRDDGGPPPPPTHGSVAGGPISRQEVLARSATWLGRVRYSQTPPKRGEYRHDCSGYVSMSWHLTSSPDSRTLRTSRRYTSTISESALRPGDALGHPGHIALFVGWAGHGRPIVREEYDRGHFATQRTWSARYAAGFTAYRYRGIR